MNRCTPIISSIALLLVAAGSATAVETITLRSGQVGGLPGLAGQVDDTVRFLPTNPPGGPVSANPFTPADFAGAAGGPAAVVINPHPAWATGISDPAARWINFDAMPGSLLGSSGSCLYAIPFFVTTPGATTALLNLELCVDDSAGDLLFGGPNPDFLYINGTGVLSSVAANFGASTFFSPTMPVTSGWNTLYLYQRDQGFGVSGIIFSATVTIPTPGAAAVLGLGGLIATRRRRTR